MFDLKYFTTSERCFVSMLCPICFAFAHGWQTSSGKSIFSRAAFPTNICPRCFDHVLRHTCFLRFVKPQKLHLRCFLRFFKQFFSFFHLSNTFISCSKDLRVIVSLLGLLEWFELLQPHQCNSEQLTLGTQLTNKCNNYHKMECTHGLWHLCQHCENMCDDMMQLVESNVIMYKYRLLVY